jgi:glycosyltransferase involved in cell wall biosynthesis
MTNSLATGAADAIHQHNRKLPGNISQADMRVAFFFENRATGGGSKYVLDCINATLQLTPNIYIITNQNAFAISEFSVLKRPISQVNIGVAERGQLALCLLADSRFGVLLRKALIVLSPLFLLVNIIKISLTLRKIAPRLLVSCNGGYPASEASLAAVIAAKINSVPCILVVMSEPARRRWFLCGYDRLLDLLVFGSASRIIANSQLQVTQLIGKRAAPANKLCGISNGIPDVTSSLRLGNHNYTNPVILGVVCRLTKLKGLAFLVEAIHLLPKTTAVELHIVGDGDGRKDVECQIDQLCLRDRVILTGYRSDEEVVAMLSTFDIFVFPSLWEGLPYSILEAMRAGLPIVSTDVGGIAEAIRDGVDGILVKPGDAHALAISIDRLISDPDFAVALGNSARKRYEKLFTLEQMYKNFSNEVASVLEVCQSQ